MCEYKEGVMVGHPRKLMDGDWPPLKATLRAKDPVPIRRWNYVKVHGPPLQGGRADGN